MKTTHEFTPFGVSAFRCGMFLLALLIGGLVGPSSSLFAQADAEEETESALPPPTPIAIVNVASIKTLYGRIDELFDSIDRRDVSELVKNFVENNLGGLNGMNQEKPFGIMLFLKTEFPPRPQPVGFIPVDSMTDLVKTVELGPTTVKKVDGAEDKYELSTPGRRRNRSMFARLNDGYAMVSRAEEMVDADLPDPTKFSTALAAQYDLGMKLDIEAIPSGVRDVFVGFMRTTTEGQLQQQDDEPDAAFRVRRANGMRSFRMIEQLLTQTKTVTMGMAKDANSVGGYFDVNVVVEPGSDFEEAIKESKARPSRFEVLFSENALLSGTMSSNLDKYDVETFTEMADAIEKQIQTDVRDENGQELSGMKPMFDALRRTIEERHLDAHVQFDGQEQGEFHMFAAVKLFNGQDVAVGLRQLLEFGATQENAPPISIDDQKIGGVDFHRIEVEDELDATGKMLFGEKPSIYIGVDRSSMWIAFGGPVVPDRLEAAMKQVNEAAGRTIAKHTDKPFRFVLNAKRWLTLPGADIPADIKDLVDLALTDENDALEFDAKPTDDGFKFQIKVQEGLMKMLLHGLARQYDRTQL